MPHREHDDDVGTVPLQLRTLTATVPADAPRVFSWRDMARKLTYDVRYLFARQRHPTE